MPSGIQCRVNLQAAQSDVLLFEYPLKLAPHGLQRVGRLGFALLLADELDRLRHDRITVRLVDDTHGNQAIERLVALFDGSLQIAKRRKNMRPTNDADNHRALALVQVAGGLAKIRSRCLLNAIRPRAKVNPVEIIRENLVLRVVRL